NFRRDLHEGGANVPAERRKEVERDIDMLKTRVASIDIKVNVDGAAMYLDDSPVCSGTETGCVGKSPLPGPIVVNPGRSQATAPQPGYNIGTAVVTVVGGDSATAKIDLVEPKTTIVRTGTDLKPVIAWTVTGVLAIGAGVTGYLTLNASNDLRDL